MLEGRRLVRRAGRTTSPDFFRTIGGLGARSSRSLSTDDESSESARNWMSFSVDEREWEMALASGVRGGTGPVSLSGLSERSALGERSDCSERMAASSLSTGSGRRTVRGEVSSSLELPADSGGEMMAPAGITALLRGGGERRRLAWGSTISRLAGVLLAAGWTMSKRRDNLRQLDGGQHWGSGGRFAVGGQLAKRRAAPMPADICLGRVWTREMRAIRHHGTRV